MELDSLNKIKRRNLIALDLTKLIHGVGTGMFGSLSTISIRAYKFNSINGFIYFNRINNAIYAYAFNWKIFR